jgi:putative FmdB family regulatory protein
MPIYEYTCGSCHRKVSLFFPSFSVAEARAAAGENVCPRCGSHNLTRVMSRSYLVRGAGSGSAESDGGDFDDMDMPGMGDDSLMPGLDEDDPRAVARWARQMKESLGPDADMGPEFDRALARIEAGEDPERVMDDMDPEAVAGGDGGEDEEF